MGTNVEKLAGPKGQFWILSDASARSLGTHVRNVEKHVSPPFRIRTFLGITNETSHEDWLAAARRAEKRFKNSASSESARASTHLLGELLVHFARKDGWSGVLNRLAVDALDGRVLDLSHTLPHGGKAARAAAGRELKSLVRVANSVYASPDAPALVGYLFAKHQLPTDGVDTDAVDDAAIDVEGKAELTKRRRKFDAEKKAQEEAWQLEQQQRQFEAEKKRRAEEQRQREEQERQRKQQEEAERRRQAEEQLRRELAEREAIKPGRYRIDSPMMQAMAGLVSGGNLVTLRGNGTFVYEAQANMMGMMQVGLRGEGNWEYETSERSLTLNGTLRLTQMNQGDDWISRLASQSVIGSMPPQPLYVRIQITSYRKGTWEGIDQDHNACSIKAV